MSKNVLPEIQNLVKEFSQFEEFLGKIEISNSHISSVPNE